MSHRRTRREARPSGPPEGENPGPRHAGDPDLPWLLVPVKSFEAGKSRLRAVLADEARHRLNEFFLRRVIAAAAHFPGLPNTAVISESARVLAIATASGVRALRQTTGPGLNRAAREGVAKLRRDGARAVLVLASDLPLIGPDDLRGIVAAGAPGDAVVLCADKHRSGTNAILLPSHLEMRFRFGRDSLGRHRRELARAGLASRVYENARVAFDIDTPADLQAWAGLADAPVRPEQGEEEGMSIALGRAHSGIAVRAPS